MNTSLTQCLHSNLLNDEILYSHILPHIRVTFLVFLLALNDILKIIILKNRPVWISLYIFLNLQQHINYVTNV